ncbi:hypothetical protein NPIL_292271 [Nephila pilipes]|uniref:Uncharacterized protein n=1 Tax=Nephila pilipes TaxID=299642 RepID=A0A8X6NAA5_NEPPI|nr:hypothetical protein NPIL_292271 [Nephila pilipes]
MYDPLNPFLEHPIELFQSKNSSSQTPIFLQVSLDIKIPHLSTTPQDYSPTSAQRLKTLFTALSLIHRFSPPCLFIPQVLELQMELLNHVFKIN